MKRVMKMDEYRNKVKSLSKAIDVLDLLCEKGSGMKLSEVSTQLSYPKSTIHALLSTMRDRGLVNQLDDGSYVLGTKLFEYGSSVSRNYDIGKISRPYLEELSSLTGYNTVISMFDGRDIVSFDYSVSRTGIQIMPEIGVRLPLHATSQGKLALSTLDEKSIVKLLKGYDFIPFTPHTITDTQSIVIQTEKIKNNGYAVEDGEYKVGLRSVSAPVYNDSGKMRYILTTIGFFRRVKSEDFQYAVDQTVIQSDKLSKVLRYRSFS